MSKKQSYQTEIVLGQRYRDTQTGIEGVATAVSFFQYGCERVTIEAMVQGKIEEYGFDTPRVVHVDSGERATTERTGGPRPLPSRGQAR